MHNMIWIHVDVDKVLQLNQGQFNFLNKYVLII